MFYMDDAIVYLGVLPLMTDLNVPYEINVVPYEINVAAVSSSSTDN